MRKYLLTAGLAAFLVAPALAQTSSGPVPSTQALSNSAPTPSTRNAQAPPTQVPGAGLRSIYTESTINEFLSDCRTDQAGCMDEIGNALLDSMSRQDKITLCLSDTDYGKPVPDWLISHTETHGIPVEDGIYLALQNLYPCSGSLAAHSANADTAHIQGQQTQNDAFNALNNDATPGFKGNVAMQGYTPPMKSTVTQ